MAPVSNDNNPEEDMKKKGYVFGKGLGEGSYAKVRITETPNNHTLACKIICKKKAPKDFVNKFLPRELDVLRRINHENIVSSVDIFEYTTKVFILMEMAENGDLLDYVKKSGNRPDGESRRLFGDIVRGMEYLHGLNIVHRDLKCENLLLFKNNKVKIADFGFGRLCVDNDGKKILSETYCGSAAYAAPEILKGTKYNPKAYDMWSIGVILFIIVCGSMPFDDSDVRKMLKVQLKNDVHFPSRVKDSIDEECKKLIRQLLEVDVTKRLAVEQARNSAWLGARTGSSRPSGQ
jgi:serine kinase